MEIQDDNIEIEIDSQNEKTITDNYENLTNKPQINNVELKGNKTLEELGIQAKGNYADQVEFNDVKNTVTSHTTLISQSGHKMQMSLNEQTYVITLSLLDAKNNVLNTQTIDLPLESVVVNASYSNKKLILTLKNGNTVEIDISDIISGLVDEDTFELLEDRVENLETENAKLRAQVEQYDNVICKTIYDIATDEDGLCEKAVELNADVEVDGNSYQESTQGYNKLIYPYSETTKTVSGITYTDLGDGTIQVNGTATGDNLFFLVESAWSWSELTYELEAGTYTFKNTGNENITLYLNAYKSDDTNEYYSTTTKDLTLTFDENVRLNIRLGVASGKSVSNAIVKPMVESGSTAHDYEPYTGGIPSPNPDYPQEITVVESAKLRHLGKNLLNEFELGTINVQTGVKTTSGNMLITTEFIKINANEDYYLTFQDTSYIFQYVGYYDSGYNFVIVDTSVNNKKSAGITTPSGVDYCLVSFKRTDGATMTPIEVSTAKPMLEQGSTATDYEPYKSETIDIDLNGNNLAKVGDIADKLVIDKKGNVGIEKNVNDYKTTGNETWKKIEVTQGNLWRNSEVLTNLTKINSKIVPLSSHFIGIKLQEWAAKRKNGYFAINTGVSTSAYYFLDIIYNNIDTVEEFTEFIKNNKPEFYYELANPQTITLPSITPITMYEGTNNFELITNLDTTFEVTYYKDKELSTRVEVLESEE